MLVQIRAGNISEEIEISAPVYAGIKFIFEFIYVLQHTTNLPIHTNLRIGTLEQDFLSSLASNTSQEYKERGGKTNREINWLPNQTWADYIDRLAGSLEEYSGLLNEFINIFSYEYTVVLHQSFENIYNIVVFNSREITGPVSPPRLPTNINELNPNERLQQMLLMFVQQRDPGMPNIATYNPYEFIQGMLTYSQWENINLNQYIKYIVRNSDGQRLTIQ